MFNTPKQPEKEKDLHRLNLQVGQLLANLKQMTAKNYYKASDADIMDTYRHQLQDELLKAREQANPTPHSTKVWATEPQYIDIMKTVVATVVGPLIELGSI